MNITNIKNKWLAMEPYFKSILRIVASTIFILAGTTILFAFPTGIPPDGGTAKPFSQIWIGGVLEVFGGALLLLGLFTRPVAFILAGEMAVAYFQFHFPQSLWPTMNGGVAAIVYCFLWLYFSAACPGVWSIDEWRAKRQQN